MANGLAFGAAGAAFSASLQLVTFFVIPKIARLIYEDPPEPKVVSILILLLDPVMYDTGALAMDLRIRSAWLRVLELMAANIETISDMFNTYDVLNNEQSRGRFARVAAYVRSLKQAVVTPKSDTFDWLKCEVTTFFRHFVLGEWDALPQADPMPMSRKSVWHIVLVRGWSAAIGSMPFAAVLYLQHMGLLLDEPFRAYLPALTFLLFVMSAWIALDPEAASKLGAAKDLGALLRVPTKPKE